MILHADPCDVMRGSVGDCWLLSAISAIAEYDRTIAWLFRKTPGLRSMPRERPNTYIVTLKDVETWEDVDIAVDERLCTTSNGDQLFGCSPSVDGELGACYLEKAAAAHCGGWDKIDGGICAAAWRMLLGVRDQYLFERDDEGMWEALRDFDPEKQRWAEFSNSGDISDWWRSVWPEVGGGGRLGEKVSQDDMFRRMALWEDADFLMACGTEAGSDKSKNDGIYYGHAYTILRVEEDVAGSGINMLQVRNPHGKGELETGTWDDDGPGWGRYPEVKVALRPVQVDDGIFWMQQHEFFQHFRTVQLSAACMNNFHASKH